MSWGMAAARNTHTHLAGGPQLAASSAQLPTAGAPAAGPGLVLYALPKRGALQAQQALALALPRCTTAPTRVKVPGERRRASLAGAPSAPGHFLRVCQPGALWGELDLGAGNRASPGN